jgi:hypothetical protein
MTAPAFEYSTVDASKSWRRSLATTAEPLTVLRVVPEEAVANAIGPISLLGEQFFADEEGGRIYITHPQWSLVGMGRTVPDAIIDLLTEARELALAMKDDDERTLSPQALRFREYVLNFR